MPLFQPFLMERLMSKHEKDVEYNLSESGVHPMSLRDLLAGNADQTELLLSSVLDYPHANGTPELRHRIAALYTRAKPENILVTVGAAEANYITIRTLLSAGDEIAIMLPNYMQIWGIARNHGIHVREFHLSEPDGWALDVDAFRDAVTPKTKLIALCNPDNPTGHILTRAEMDHIITAASRVGAWILADEVYSGAERLTDTETPSFYGRYDKVIAVGSLSKAYGLPGLRIGWAAGPSDTIDEIWARHEYTTISASIVSNLLASIALAPEVRPRLIQRAREYIRIGYAEFESWIDRQNDIFSLTPPAASAIAFPRYRIDLNSTALAERLRTQKGVLVVPGDHFGFDHHVRISFGLPPEYMIPALDRIHDLITELTS